jgi:hypothetical protein
MIILFTNRQLLFVGGAYGFPFYVSVRNDNRLLKGYDSGYAKGHLPRCQGSCEKFGIYPLTLPSPTRGEGKHIEIRKKFLPLDGGGPGWG